MELKNLDTKYFTVMIFDLRSSGLFPTPQITDISAAKVQYGDRKVAYFVDDDERKMTEIGLA